MVVLALDTTTRAGGVAVLENGIVLASRQGDPGLTHGERLPNEILSLLSQVGKTLSDVGLYAVCVGPGSFTGLRVGLATVQGLAMATGRLIVPVPTLEALARTGWEEDGGEPRCIVPLMNAYRGELFAAVYESDVETAGGEGSMKLRLGPLVGAAEVIVDALESVLNGRPSILVGDGVADAVRVWEGAPTNVRVVRSDMPTLAPMVARIASRADRVARRRPHGIRPTYVRRPDAELARERRQASETSNAAKSS